MAIILFLYVTFGILLVVLSIPLILGKVAPNSWYGFRVKQTLEDPNVWYAANAFSAKRFMVVGIVTSISAILLFFVPNIALDAYAYACLGVAMVGLIVALIQSFRFLRTISQFQFRRF